MSPVNRHKSPVTKVVQIKAELADRREPFAAIAKRYGVERKVIENIAKGRLWKHVFGPPAAPVNGRSVFNTGSRSASSRLSEEDVLFIRKVLVDRSMTQRALAHKFGVAESTISAIKRGQNRKEQP